MLEKCEAALAANDYFAMLAIRPDFADDDVLDAAYRKKKAELSPDKFPQELAGRARQASFAVDPARATLSHYKSRILYTFFRQKESASLSKA